MSIFNKEEKIKLKYYQSYLVRIIIPLAYLYLWYTYYPSTIDEFLLLTQKTEISNGFITKAEEIEDYVDVSDGRRTVKELDFNFEYYFITSRGDTITSFGSKPGRLPDFLENVRKNPFPVKVEYLLDHPEINRISAVWTTGVKSLYQWFLKKIIWGLAGFIFSCYLSFYLFKDVWKKYKN